MQSIEGVPFKCLYRMPSGKTANGQLIGTYSSERRAAFAFGRTQEKGYYTRGDTEEICEGKRRVQGRLGKFELRMAGQYCGRFESTLSASRNLVKIPGKVNRMKLAAKRFASAKDLQETFKTWRPADMKDLRTMFCFAVHPGPSTCLPSSAKSELGEQRS